MRIEFKSADGFTAFGKAFERMAQESGKLAAKFAERQERKMREHGEQPGQERTR